MSSNFKLNNFLKGDYFLYISPTLFRFIFTFFIVLPITTFFLDPEDFGFFALLLGVTLPIQAIGASGSKWALGGNFFWDQDKRTRSDMIFNSLAYELLVRSCIILSYFLLAEIILSNLLANPTEVDIQLFYILLISIWFGSLWPTISFILVLQKKARIFAFLTVFQVLINGLVSILCLWIFNLGVETLFIAILVTNFLSFIIEIFFIKDYISLKFSMHWFKEISKSFGRSIPGGLAETFLFLSERVLIQKHVGLFGLGIYSHSQLYQSVLKSLNGAITNTISSDTFNLYSKKNNKGSIKNSIKIINILEIWLYALLVIGFGFIFFGDDLISFITHDKFTEAAIFLPMWILSAISISYGMLFSQFLVAQKKTKFLMISQFLPSLLGIISMIFFIKSFGLIAAPIIIILVNISTHLTRRFYCNRLNFNLESEFSFIRAFALIVIFMALDLILNPTLFIELIIFVVSTIFFGWLLNVKEKASNLIHNRYIV